MQNNTAFCQAWLLALGIGIASAAWAGSVQPPARTPFPTLSLGQPHRGEAAIQALGSRLPEVAAWYGKTPAEFARLIREDKDLWLDGKGRAYFVDQGLAIPRQAGEPAAIAADTSVSEATATLDQVPVLHSKPGANRVIHLDFNGATVSGTAWNTGNYPSTVNAAPYDTDGNTASFSDAEIQNIQNIWKRVAEDYAPFDVDVTTEQPASAQLTRADLNDATFGTTVVITNDWTAATGNPCRCGGFAYLRAFDDTSEYYKPAWVFANNLGNGYEKYVAEAISHEAGHNLGLSHDGTPSVGYYEGHGSGATGWAPIMGVGYYRELTQWSKGEYPNANNKEDDFTLIQSYGAPLRADDHGDSAATATDLTGTVNAGIQSLSAAGLIGSRTDADIFRFSSGTGTITINLAVYEKGPNLDISLGLYDGNGILITSSNPVDGLGANLSYAAPAGTYYLRVDGIGKGTTNDGYSDYGSLGQYTVAVSAPTTDSGPVNSAPVAGFSTNVVSGTAPLTVQFTDTSSDPDGDALSYAWDFGDGSSSSAASPNHTYNSAGTYTAQLTVTDPSNAQDTAQTTITVNTAITNSLHVGNIAMSKTKGKTIRAKATVPILDAGGKAVVGATVTGTWSGIVSGNVSGVTGSNGTVTLSSPGTSASTGTFIFTVTGVTLSGYSYDSAQNVETSDSITR